MTDMHVRCVGRPPSSRDRRPADSIRAVYDAGARARARAVGLHYRTDRGPGIRRVRSGSGFGYVGRSGKRIADEAVIDWIRSIAIPPAWTDVWINPDPDAHLLATGRDARGRKVYRYHRRFRSVMDRAKFRRIVEFGRRLPRIRRQVKHDLRRRGLERDVVLAAVVRLLELTLIRIGNEEYARANGSVGLTTLRSRHVDVHGSTIRFHFRGKAGRQHEVELVDRRLATVVERLLALPGALLFRFRDEDGEPRRVTSALVNDYLREAAGADVTAKDYRTWYATVLAYRALRETGPASTDRASRRRVNAAVAAVADRLGNTPAIAKASYIHPAVVEAYVEDELAAAPAAPTPAGSRRPGNDRAPAKDSRPRKGTGLTEGAEPVVVPGPAELGRRDELAVLRLLERSAPAARPRVRPAAGT